MAMTQLSFLKYWTTHASQFQKIYCATADIL